MADLRMDLRTIRTLEEYSGYRLTRYQLQAHTMIQYKVWYNVSDVAMKLSLDAIQAKDGALWIHDVDSITEMNYITALEILWESQRQRGNIGKQDTAGERERERESEIRH